MSMTIIPKCPGCGREAPPPKQAQGWSARPNEDGRGAFCLCPGCSASPEVVQRLKDERRRESLAVNLSPEAIVFPNGYAKVLADCTVEDLTWLELKALERAEQAMAWGNWFEELRDLSP
jgi:hypothetical protein